MLEERPSYGCNFGYEVELSLLDSRFASRVNRCSVLRLRTAAASARRSPISTTRRLPR